MGISMNRFSTLHGLRLQEAAFRWPVSLHTSPIGLLHESSHNRVEHDSRKCQESLTIIPHWLHHGQRESMDQRCLWESRALRIEVPNGNIEINTLRSRKRLCRYNIVKARNHHLSSHSSEYQTIYSSTKFRPYGPKPRKQLLWGLKICLSETRFIRRQWRISHREVWNSVPVTTMA